MKNIAISLILCCVIFQLAICTSPLGTKRANIFSHSTTDPETFYRIPASLLRTSKGTRPSTLRITTVLLLLASLAGFGQEFKAGFKSISTYDSSRHYKPNARVQDTLHYRPIEIDLWYPADVTSSDTTASFVDFVNLLEQRSKLFDDTKDYNGLTDELLQYICSSTNCPDANFLKSIKSESYVNAKAIDNQFPLVVYLAGFNGMSYENYMLLEQLAKNGFIVASVSSIGRYPGNMTMESEDLFEQIEDARFVIKQITKKCPVSKGIGLIGYSWGGLAASVLAMSEQSLIKAVVSLDGSEQFVYMGNEDIKELTNIRESTFFKPENIRAT